MPTCLFFCPDHALSSRLAEALFNAQSPRGWRATSAGIAPAATADPRAEAVLGTLGYRVPDGGTRAVEKDLVSFMRVVVAVGVPADTALPDWLVPKVDRRLEIDDPRALTAEQLQDWMARLNEKLEDVLALCRERTPRPFG
ncbi:MAG: hypothetical protein KGJ23_14675 [Euryarchaeota archaeon]|nr:hypothetical protein [Euryarchaeota archaeon]MDE1837845.1 hypothetical protein [Euryarchaeota archaeon]MDE1880129.1 hypothetical protein [Euryarchaeota archaeon]MDE2046294.1 hypothetical protein [Thermoplasmata archaeon]